MNLNMEALLPQFNLTYVGDGIFWSPILSWKVKKHYFFCFLVCPKSSRWIRLPMHLDNGGKTCLELEII